MSGPRPPAGGSLGPGPQRTPATGSFESLLWRGLMVGIRRRIGDARRQGRGSLAFYLVALPATVIIVMMAGNLALSHLSEGLESRVRAPDAMEVEPLLYLGIRRSEHAARYTSNKGRAWALNEGLRDTMGYDRPMEDQVPEIYQRFKEEGISAFAPSGMPDVGRTPSLGRWPIDAHREDAQAAIALLFTLYAGGLISLSLGRQLAEGAADREDLPWLMTFPLSPGGLIGARIFSATVLSPLTALLSAPLLYVLFRTPRDSTAIALFLALIAAYALGLLIESGAALGALFLSRGAGGRASLGIRGGLVALGGALLMAGPLLLGMPGGAPSPLAALAPHLPRLLLYLPPGALVSAAFDPLAWIPALAGVGLGLALTLRLGAPLLQADPPPPPRGAAPITAALGAPTEAQRAPQGRPSLLTALGPLAEVEFTRLRRDPARFAATWLLPAVLLAALLALGGDALRAALPGFEGVVALAFGLGAAAILSGTADARTSEAPQLWLLMSLPHDPMALLAQKARFWGLVGIGLSLLSIPALMAIGWGAGGIGWGIFHLPVLIAGLWMMAHLGVGLSAVFPREDGKGMRPLGLFLYLFLTLRGLIGLTASDAFGEIASVLITAVATLALWDLGRRRLRVALDPSPPPEAPHLLTRTLIALLLFFGAQGFFVGVILGAEDSELWKSIGLLVAYGMGAAIALNALFPALKGGRGQKALRALGLTPPTGRRPGPDLLAGLAWALGLTVVMVSWLTVVDQVPALRALWEAQSDTVLENVDSPWFLGTLVVLAPVAEEIFFRRALLRGLVPLLGAGGALVLSALLFISVHPSVGAPPIFGLALATGWMALRTRWLGGAILCHALYNLAVILARSAGLGPL